MAASASAPSASPTAATPDDPALPRPATAAGALARGASAATGPRPAAARPLTQRPPSRTLPPQPEPPARRRPSGRVLAALAAAALAIVAGGFALAATLLGGEDDAPVAERPASPSTQAADQPAGGTAQDVARPGTCAGGGPRTEREQTTISVLNGTQRDGLARQVATRLEECAYSVPLVATATDQLRESTVVAFAEGAQERAQGVARVLELEASAVQPIDPDLRAEGGDSPVVVVLGADAAAG